MDRWLDDPELLDWLERTRELHTDPSVTQESLDELLRQEIAAQLEPLARNLLQSRRFRALILEGTPGYLRELLRQHDFDRDN
jgi:hypothetical protein